MKTIQEVRTAIASLVTALRNLDGDLLQLLGYEENEPDIPHEPTVTSTNEDRALAGKSAREEFSPSYPEDSADLAWSANHKL